MTHLGLHKYLPAIAYVTVILMAVAIAIAIHFYLKVPKQSSKKFLLGNDVAFNWGTVEDTAMVATNFDNGYQEILLQCSYSVDKHDLQGRESDFEYINFLLYRGGNVVWSREMSLKVKRVGSFVATERCTIEPEIWSQDVELKCRKGVGY